MNNTSLRYYQSGVANRRGRVNPYLEKEVMESSQEKLLLKTYDFALVHCKKRDIQKTNKAIDVLINGLDLQFEVARDLYSLYQFCKEEMRKENTDLVYSILSGLKDAWVGAFNKQAVAI